MDEYWQWLLAGVLVCGLAAWMWRRRQAARARVRKKVARAKITNPATDASAREANHGAASLSARGSGSGATTTDRPSASAEPSSRRTAKDVASDALKAAASSPHAPKPVVERSEANPPAVDAAKAEAVKAEAARAHAARRAAEQTARAELARIAAEVAAKAEAARRAKEEAQREQAARAEAQRRAADAAAREQAAAEQAARQQAVREQAAREQAEREKAERQRAEQAERAQREHETRERAREEAERQEAERRAREDAVRAEAARAEARAQAERRAAESKAADAVRQPAPTTAPIAAAPASPRASAPLHKTPEQTLVVVADDSKIVRVKTGRLLTQHKYRVAYAEDGLDAVQQVRNHQPDVVITDVEMPGMDGFELTRHLRQDPHTAHIPVIMITAANDKHREDADRAGVNVLLGKPYEDDELIAHIRSAVNGGTTQAGALA